MNYYNFIFSDKNNCRFARHFTFWLMVFLYHLVRISFLYPTNNFIKNEMSIFWAALIWGTLFNMIISYTVVYYLVPKFYNKRKYLVFVLALIILLIAVLALNMMNLFLNKQMAHAISSDPKNQYLFIKATFIRLLGNPPLICGLLLSLKTIKNWYLKQKENETLKRENINAELQLLKAQIHPHFLFNTLNNIYSFTLTESKEAAGLVEKLSDTLHYMITDCNATLVPLEKEFKMLNDYMYLEKVRYGNQLKMDVHIKGNFQNKLIAPLLMIPFIENSFKHGTSQVLLNPWIKLLIVINENELVLEVSNSKPLQPFQSNKKNGIGLQNVKKRLQLLYHEQHKLIISSTDESFFIHLKIPLQQTDKPVFNRNKNIYTNDKITMHAE